jgi:hypothetical protein
VSVGLSVLLGNNSITLPRTSCKVNQHLDTDTRLNKDKETIVVSISLQVIKYQTLKTNACIQRWASYTVQQRRKTYSWASVPVSLEMFRNLNN